MARKSRSRQNSKGAGTRSSKAKSSGKKSNSRGSGTGGGAKGSKGGGQKSGGGNKKKTTKRKSIGGRSGAGTGGGQKGNPTKKNTVSTPNSTTRKIANLPSNYKATEQKAFKEAAKFKQEQQEQRKQQLKINLSNFDADSYLNRYQDLRDAFGTDKAAARQHYQTYGFNEKRDISPFTAPKPSPKLAVTTGEGMSMTDKAKARDQNFKATGVQTFGGTRQNYSLKEAMKIEKALGKGSFSTVTRGAKNPLAKAPINPNIKVGELMPSVAGFGMTDADKFMSGAPNVNYNFSERDTSLPSMRTLSKADLSGFSKSLGINRDNFGGGKNAFSGSPSDLGYTMRDMFQAKDLGNMTTNALTKYVPGLTIRPMSMADRDRQSYLGFNPNKPSSYLKATDPGRPKGQRQGTTSYSAPVNTTTATTGSADDETVKEEAVESNPVEQTLPDLSGISDDEYNEVISELTGGNNTGTDSNPPNVASISQTTGIDPGIIERILAGYRGKKRIKFGSGKNESLKLRRGSSGFMSRIPQFILSSLNV